MLPLLSCQKSGSKLPHSKALRAQGDAVKLRFSLIAIALLCVAGCVLCDMGRSGMRPDRNARSREIVLEVTGYCKCGHCCGWRRTWYGRPVTLAGAPKEVGITASGVRARPGTVAADTTLFPFGTIMHIPGYGYGVVQDRGGDIKGRHIDLYFRSHRAAQNWGRKKVKVRVWEK